ncbi:hypothetical protein ID866_4303 [Astraeus odoratus]|nr:hypothetical protein ID866_4303 [Astraeus odoratus]
MISGTQLATTSNNVLGHTSKAACYVVETQLGAKVNLWEAAGLVGETHLSSRRLQDLKTFLRRLLLFHSIDLLIFCMHAGRVKKTFIQSYQAAYIQTCERKVPVALIVTGLEREKGDMHGWWSRNRDNIFHHDLAFDVHACVTTLQSHEDPYIQKKINLSRRRLRELIQRSDYVGLPHDHICPFGWAYRFREEFIFCAFHDSAYARSLGSDTRTIVVVGADGVGKSSIVNAIAGESLAATSKDTNTCTRDCASYRVKLESGVQITIWDTVGLDGTAETEGKVTALINHLSHFPGIDLLLFCVRGKLKSQFERFKNVLSCVPENVAPVALVVTGLETESDINTWWSNNKDNPKIRDLAADAHACVTTLWPSLENPALLKRIYASQRRLRELVQHPLPVRGFTVEHTSSSSESNIFKSEPSPSLASVSFYDLTQGDAVIILLGPTGSGKSLFISRLAGISEDKAGVGHDLCSHTDRIKVFRFTDTTGIPVVLVDTPGFNNTNLALPDEKICALMHSWLSETYKRDIIVAGILYFHPTGGVTNQFLRPFWSVYGETMYSRLIIVMTMCDDCTGQKGAIEHRTEDLERMLAGGAKTIRYENSEESARTVCRPVLDSLAVVRGLHLRRAVTDLDQELQKLAEGRKASAIRDVDKLSYMEQLADEHLELLRHVREQSKEDIYKLQKRCEEIRRQMNDILAQMKYAETPSTKRIMRCLRTYW